MKVKTKGDGMDDTHNPVHVQVYENSDDARSLEEKQ